MQAEVEDLVSALTHRGEPLEQRDDLTQLYTRGAFDRALKKAIDEASREKQPLSLIFGDIDHFKKVNDTHGHQAGDAVLREVARRLELVARGKGAAYRYGGEELAIILINHSAHEGLAVAERARREIEKASVGGIAVSISFGVACVPDHASDVDGLIGAADRAVYEAKDRGRNLVRLSGEPAPAQPRPSDPERKLPETGRLTDQQKTELRRRLLRRDPIECPEDGAIFEVHDITSHGSVGRDFLIACPNCGLSDRLIGGQR
jgi:diguanylate cyclase (GGDEF)-like protein